MAKMSKEPDTVECTQFCRAIIAMLSMMFPFLGGPWVFVLQLLEDSPIDVKIHPVYVVSDTSRIVLPVLHSQAG